jgi:hypothetical protein
VRSNGEGIRLQTADRYELVGRLGEGWGVRVRRSRIARYQEQAWQAPVGELASRTEVVLSRDPRTGMRSTAGWRQEMDGGGTGWAAWLRLERKRPAGTDHLTLTREEPGDGPPLWLWEPDPVQVGRLRVSDRPGWRCAIDTGRLTGPRVGLALGPGRRLELVIGWSLGGWQCRWLGGVALAMVRRMRAAWCDIDLEALRANADALVRQAGVPLLPIIKAEAYGHGLLPVARCLGGHPGVWGMGVALTGEAAALRRDGFTGRVLVLGGILPEECEEAVTAGATVALSSLTLAEMLGRTATALGRTVSVHLKVDVGMNRLGVPAAVAAEAAERIAATPGLRLEGILCHLGAAHEGDPASLARTRAEIARFEELTAPIIARHGPLVRHAANSSALLTLPESSFDLVRPGLTLYGWRPAEWLPPRPEFRPVL